ncbi:MAG: hypothetical protein K8R67_16505 [Desulfobacteraceae bacterium]|nr:hypothetical protein [Desulfobacteraceae bacterium]
MDKYEIQKKIFQEKLFIPGTNVLKNKKGITDKKTLKEFEGKHFSNKSLSVPMGDLSTKNSQTSIRRYVRMGW